MNILVTGCNGQLGRAIQNEYKDEVEFILTDVVEKWGHKRQILNHHR